MISLLGPNFCRHLYQPCRLSILHSFRLRTQGYHRKMGKKKSSTPSESFLLLPTPPSTLPIVDTHTHLASTFEMYRTRYKEGSIKGVYEFVKHMYHGRNVEAIVDVWCEAPVRSLWKTFADSALTKEDRETIWNGMDYWFVIGGFPLIFRLLSVDAFSNISSCRCTSVRCLIFARFLQAGPVLQT